MIAHRLALCIALAIGAGAGVAGRADAQSYPDRLIKIVVPYPPGGPIDITARLVAQRLGPILGQTVIIENRGGAGGALGTKAAAAAEPDGYTLLFGNASAFVVGPAVYRFRDYDTLKQFTPIAKVTEGYEVLVVAPDFPPKNVQELIAYAKARPGKLNFGSMGYGNLTHLVAELFKLQTGPTSCTCRTKARPRRSPASSPGRCIFCSGRWRGCCRSCAKASCARSGWRAWDAMRWRRNCPP
jgi:tripartite-type tricarboxylate transporter receptor subunit TctC